MLIQVLRAATRRYSTAMTKLPAFLESKRPASSPEFDYSTLSNYRNYKVNNTILDLNVLFNKSAIKGSVTYDLSVVSKTSELALDTSYLDIEKVELDGQKVDFTCKDRKEPLGSCLQIQTDQEFAADKKLKLKLHFSTTEKCTALQWLNEEQTDSNAPYVFSQLEAIHARSLFPCFDTPAVKSTFTANITSTLPVVFSGIEQKVTDNGNGTKTYSFEQKVPIPSYLIGIASGQLQSAEIGPRSKVYSEPFRLKDAQWEFEGDVEKFIKAAEKIIFPYEWGTYDILVNVNSYPYGGMESPNMTFATPTLIAHDKSNISVIAHELAHSWSGNLVTNCSWNHFWLNEGWTVYLERRILAELAGEPTRHFNALIGWNDLENSINAMKNSDRFSCLIQDLSDGTDPDDAFSSVPYEKGSSLLFHLENVLGGKAEFDSFIKHYFTKYSKKSLDSFEFLDTLFDFFPHKREVLDSVDWKTWLYTPGMPPKPKFITDLADDVYSLTNKWVSDAKSFKSVDQFKSAFSVEDVAKFDSNQIILFLDTLVQSTEVKWSENKLAVEAFLEIYKKPIVESRNAEVGFRTFKFTVTAQLSDYYPKLADWLGTVGRMKFVRPGYRLLNSVDRSLALETFDKFKKFYHPICSSLVKQDLDL